MKIIRLHIPEYNNSPDLYLRPIAKAIDHALTDNFDGQKVLLRAVSSEAHECSQDELVQIIQQRGTDRYDPDREGDRYKNAEGKKIDLFGRICTIKPGALMSRSLLEGFHIYGAKYHGRPSGKMDVWLVYDRAQLKAVSYMQLESSELKRDGYVFKFPESKLEALLGVIVID